VLTCIRLLVRKLDVAGREMVDKNVVECLIMKIQRIAVKVAVSISPARSSLRCTSRCRGKLAYGMQ
jgi:hypothetical protein